MTKKTHAWYADKYVNKYGMKLLPLKPGSKLPKQKDWGDTETPPEYWEQYPQDNIGLNLGASGFCSLDIDCLESFALILEEYGLPVEQLGEYPTIKGASKGKRLVFKIPDGMALPYVKLNWPKKDDPKKQYTVFELRSAEANGKARQDVLPPSIHPDTQQPYTWEAQPADPWPIPPDWLIAIWGAWDSFKPQFKEVCPWVKPEPKPERRMPPPKNTDANDCQAVVDAYISANPLAGALESYGYKRIGKRYLSPHSGTKLPGVIPFDGGQTCWVHHASDPLCSDESGQPVNSYDLFTYYEHGGDRSASFKAAMKITGVELKRERPTPVASSTKPPEHNEQPPELPDEPPEQVGQPFKALGYSGTAYYYLPKGTEQVCEIKRSGHTSPAELLSMAPLEWWESIYPKKNGGADWQAAGNDLMRACERAGIYSHERERGRGAWHDNGRAVLHLGDRLLVDAKPVSIHAHKTSYIYTRQAPLEHGGNATPATDEHAATVADLITGLNWSTPDHARLLAGWCFLAPICGALKWRPHAWLTAQRGAGKTWVQDHIINPLIGPAAMMVQGSTTEAGIRQRLKQDARPIVFDEAESEDQNSQKRMKTVIELARQSSSDSTAEIVKGTASGGGMAFRMRSMFLLGSINVSLNHAADESRFSVLSLSAPSKDPSEADRFDKFSKKVDNTLTDEFCASIRARAYQLIPVIRNNAKTIARAVAEQLGSQRLGDQVGTLLAGEYGLRSSNELTLEEARKWVFDMDFSEAKEAESASDEQQCINAILERQIRFDSERGSIQRSMAEVVGWASGADCEHWISAREANSIIQRYGLLVEGGRLIIANKHNELEKLLKDTAFASGWRRILKRFEGAEAVTKTVRFAGVRSRATSVPLSEVM